MSRLPVSRYGKPSALDRRGTGDFISVDDVELGETRRIVALEYERAKQERPDNPALAMRPMFFTGSPFGREILALVNGGKE